MKKSIAILISAGMAVFTLGCSEKAVDKVADAQACLDTASQATVNSCLEKISGVETRGAYLVRCAAKFIEEGFDNPNKLSLALSSLGGAGSSATLSAMNILAFTLPAAQTNAELASTYCARAESKGLIMLSSIVRMATALKAVSGVNGDIPAAVAACAASCDPAILEAIGQAAVIAYESNCSGGGSSVGDLCQQFGSVVSGGNSQSIGQSLAQCLNAPATPGCQGF